MADPQSSITSTRGGFDEAAFYRRIFAGDVPQSEWMGRARYGALLDLDRVDNAIRAADVGIMWLLADIVRECLQHNPKAQGILGKAIAPLATADYDVTPAEGDGIDKAEAERWATFVRTALAGLRGFRQGLHDLGIGFLDGRAALEVEYATPNARGERLPRSIEWIVPQRLSYGPSRELLIIDRWGDAGLFRRRGPVLDDVPGKFIQFKPRMFGELQEREGLAPRYVFWLIFDRFVWRHRMKLTESFGFPWRIIEQELANTLSGLKLPRADGGEGGSPGDDTDALDYTLAEAQQVVRDGTMVLLPGQKATVTYPPAEVNEFFTQGSEQIMNRLDVLTNHVSIATDAPRANAIVLKSPEDTLFNLRGLLINEAIQTDLVNVLVELNGGPSALPYAPKFQLRTQAPRDRNGEVDRIIKVSAAVPVGRGTLYEASGIRPPNQGEELVTPPAPPGLGDAGGMSGPPAGGAARGAPATSRDEGSSGEATDALRGLLEDADVDDQADAVDAEAETGPAALERWFASGRKVQPRSANGTPEVLVEKGVREASRFAARWIDDMLDDADGSDPAKLYRRLQRAGEQLDIEPFARALERRLLHGLMLGALDADWEMSNEAVIAPASFAFVVPAAAGVADFATMPFGEAIRAFTSRKVLTRRAFDRLVGAAKRQAFTVAGLQRKAMVSLAHDELAKAIEAGDDLRTFSKALNARFESAGWKTLNPSHLETVFRNGVMNGYSDGRRAQMTQPAVLAARPYWQVLGVDDDRTRAPHKKAHGKVLAASDPFWTRAPLPWGHNCRCRSVSRSARDLERLGLAVTIGAQLRGLPDEGWDASGSLL